MAAGGYMLIRLHKGLHVVETAVHLVKFEADLIQMQLLIAFGH